MLMGDVKLFTTISLVVENALRLLIFTLEPGTGNVTDEAGVVVVT